MISSTKNPKVRWIRQLQIKGKQRQSEGVFVLEGVRLVEEALKSQWKVDFLVHTKELSKRGWELVNVLGKKDTEVVQVSQHVMRALSDTKTPQGILAVVSMRSLPVPDHLDFVLVLDQVREPGNEGTILRSAAAAGVQLVILTPGTVDPYSPKVLRAGMGAQLMLPVRNDTWDEIGKMKKDSNLVVFLAEVGNGEIYHQCDLSQPLALIVGGEADGASETAHRVADFVINIPMPGGSDSLNVSVSAGILLFEIARQRGTGL